MANICVKKAFSSVIHLGSHAMRGIMSWSTIKFLGLALKKCMETVEKIKHVDLERNDNTSTVAVRARNLHSPINNYYKLFSLVNTTSKFFLNTPDCELNESA